MTYLYKEYIYILFVYAQCTGSPLGSPLRSPGRQEAAGSDAGTDPCHSCESVSWKGRPRWGVFLEVGGVEKRPEFFLGEKEGQKEGKYIYIYINVYIYTYLDYVFRKCLNIDVYIHKTVDTYVKYIM